VKFAVPDPETPESHNPQSCSQGTNLGGFSEAA
jgi:hypothetical protein